jgi:hypothetical protein
VNATGAQTAHATDMSGAWVGVGVALLVGVVAVWAILASSRRQQREMDELWEAARRVDREWYAALYRYLNEPPAVKPATKPAVRVEPPEAITVELEVIKIDEGTRGLRKDG